MPGKMRDADQAAGEGIRPYVNILFTILLKGMIIALCH